MQNALNLRPARWQEIGSLPGGSIPAMAVGPGQAATVFAGTRVGVYRATGLSGLEGRAWERLDGAPVGTLALSVSPAFAADRSVLAGGERGIWRSEDGGDHWRMAGLPLSNSAVLCIAHSPAFEEDGILLAGTLEDGVLYSDSRGAHWSGRGFGILDPTVLSIAFSPAFKRDGTAFAGTDTCLYKTYNHARAWKALPFPEEAAPVVSLAVSPNFASDSTLFAGSETSGLFRSTDGGKGWSQMPLPAGPVNALWFAGGGLWAAAGSGLFRSNDGGESWDCLLEQPDVISLALGDGLVLAGTVDDGLWFTADGRRWQQAAGLSVRSVSGCVLSDDLTRSQTAYLYGPQEGIWRTVDGGSGWREWGETLPALDILDLATHGRRLAAATPEGVLVSDDGGETWRCPHPAPARRLAFSEDGRLLAANLAGQGVQISGDLGQTWEAVPGPWDAGGEVLALGIGGDRRVHIALLEGLGERVSIWLGAPGAVVNVLSQPVSEHAVASFYLPREGGGAAAWYAAVERTVWKIGPGGAGEAMGPALEAGEALVALSGWGPAGRETLFASAGRRLHRFTPGQGWQPIADFGHERAIAVVPSPAYASDHAVFALLLGGSFYRAIMNE